MRIPSSLVAGLLALAAGVVVSSPAMAIIRRTGIDCKPTALPGVKTAIPTMDADPEPQQNPEAVVRFNLTINVSDTVPNGLLVRKAQLDASETYGFGLPNGYTTPPPADPTGPWQGLMWPFRDFADGYAGGGTGAPGGDSIGEVNSGGAPTGFYQITGVAGRMNYLPTSSNTWNRGIPGNGVTDFARLFAFDVISIVPIERTIRIDVSEINATMLMRSETGQLFEQEFTFPSATLSIIIPAPSGLALLTGGGLMAARRRRR